MNQRDAAADAKPGVREPEGMITEDARTREDAQVPLAADKGFAKGQQYAVLARFYGLGTGGWFSEEAVAKVTVEGGDEGGLALDWQYCGYRGQLVVVLPPLPTTHYAATGTRFFPHRRFALNITGQRFEAAGAAAFIGYDEGIDCPAGTTASHPERPWLAAGTCSCPSSDALPAGASDCRVNDLDEDDHPGITTRFTGGSQNSSYVRIREHSQIINGTISADGRHGAQLASNVDTLVMSCAVEPCTRGNAQLCPLETNPVRFLPLDDDKTWGCDDVVRAVDESGLIGLGLPVRPSGC